MAEEENKEAINEQKAEHDVKAEVKHGNPFTSAFKGTLGKGCGCITLVIIGLIALGVIAGLGSSSSKKEETTQQQASNVTEEASQQVQEEQAGDIEVNLSSFVGEFDDNQLAAETKYEDRWIKFTGYIDNISEGIMGEYYVIVQPSAEEYYLGTSVQCYFDTKEALLNLKNGQRVTLRGKVDTQVMNVLVKSCEVVE
jgi:type II secretory pathway pseudopilin PulG